MANLDPFSTTDSSDDASDDWPARASATVVQYVETIRDKTTGPAITASRYVVYLLAVALIAVIVAIIGLVLTVRLLVSATAYAPGVEPGETWLAYLIIGVIFCLAGLWAWRKKER